ncbi:dihydrodipicolinate reductase [Frankia sp. AgB1.9]|uniref:dihydrodipicolinate reductase n=1 Tax=unclassified Frankia TaxID=2632575 RepID=UPI0019337247|nr:MULTISPECIES: dihydrodipicolinate reductase [unclassified Frankia]MBL7489468.1 dihydrodipicolinate reductase [Frankia sp. AgW1.1]MBL7548069.1 dihydrodipicolinate reductase [Frankia sp. AgB1.9]MBL7617938.1 dihydrodipicolinate reductase [Frankia sp. AgB1.8]
MVLRVVHSGTGLIGRATLDGILNHPELELVGMYVQSPEKIGKDAGTFIGREATGVRTTNNWDELLDLAPDCLSYQSNSIARELDAANDVCRFLESGVNAVTASVFAWGYPPDVPAEFAHVHEACARGNSSAFFSGSDPGWATTDLAIAALRMADEVECVRVCELGYWGGYEAEYVCREYFGFGQKPGFEPVLVKGGFLRQMWEPTLRELCDAMGVDIEDWNTVYETDSLDHDIETGFGTVHAGTASVVRFELQALNGGRPVAVVEHVDRVGMGSGPQWKGPFGPEVFAFRIEVEGNPSFTLEHQVSAPSAASDGTARTGNSRHFAFITAGKSTAMPLVNAIPAVCAAGPGLLGPRDVGHPVSRNVRRAH